MQKKRFTYKIHTLFFLLYFLSSFLLFWYSPRQVGYNFGLAIILVWNCFLSFLSLVFARHAAISRQRKRNIWILWVFLWIIFWPNTFYIITDVAHFTENSFYKAIPYQESIYSTNIQLWAKGIMIVTGILYGILNGIMSEMIIENHIINDHKRIIKILFRVSCSILGGIGIYIGRFLRFNSWDIFKPWKLISDLQINNWNFTIDFVIMFTIFIFFTISFIKPLIKESNEIQI
jgi:uncharacterized membrane protein